MKTWNVQLKKRLLLAVIISSIVVFLSGCESNTSFAPVVNAWHQRNADVGTYLVKKDDTLYSVAWAFDIDYQAVAAANDLTPPYRIEPGQRLKMVSTPRGYHPEVQSTRAAPPSPRTAKSKPVYTPNYAFSEFNGVWVWPAQGRLVEGFRAGYAGGNKGIDITGRVGTPVYASAAGVVVYSGSGVREYGNLIILKHNNSYLSAYAFNKVNLVGLGARVRAGQQIAEMGRTNSGQVRLHFEIRRNGQSIDPMNYLRR